MSDCVFEALEGTRMHANPDVGFAQQVYDAWTGAGERIKTTRCGVVVGYGVSFH
tara:strand:- start:2040 stop:2201 length:162 start_codon:yes stop_codon:yes gene_type:complete